MDTKNKFTRRSFLGTAATAAGGFTILPSNVIAGLGYQNPSDKLNIAGIGIGGIGYRNLRNMESENIVALCDVDPDYAVSAFQRWDTARQYTDYRVMLEERTDIDAVVIATPDHSHALPALLAMREGKHVFLQQPLSHSVYESRILRETANRYRVATQMGNQGNSGEGIRLISEWIWAGVIGEVTHVDAWTNRPIWPQQLEQPERTPRVPRDLDWDLFIGPAAWREYNPIYHPWNWRAWWDFGSGALGDMGTHILDPVFSALMLEYPTLVEANSTPFNTQSLPNAEHVRYEFPRRDNLPKVGMPEVTINWYDGGMLPTRPEELRDGEQMGDENGGCIFHGTRGKIMCGAYAQNPTLLPSSEMENFNPPEKQIRRITDAMSGGHERDWIRACKETPDYRLSSSSNFNYAAPLTETVLLGVLATRLQSLQRRLLWDGPNMRFTNIDRLETLRILEEASFEIENGNPQFNREYATLPAAETAAEWIRPTYRQGWEQI